MDCDGIPTRIFPAEHLCAIALPSWRARHFVRVTMFLEQLEVHPESLQNLATGMNRLIDCEGPSMRAAMTRNENAVNLDEEKSLFNARAKVSMLQFLRSKSWPEKIRPIERMNEAAPALRKARRRARERKAGSSRE